MMPFIRRDHGVIAWSVVGLVTALGRFATITAIALAVQPPALVYALLLPGLGAHATFGVLSGLVAGPLVRASDRTHDDPDTPTDPESEPAAEEPRARP